MTMYYDQLNFFVGTQIRPLFLYQKYLSFFDNTNIWSCGRTDPSRSGVAANICTKDDGFSSSR
jgi:hypothetical protein